MLGRATEYAIRALVYICIRNLEGKTPGFREVAREIESPVPYTGKILQNLVRARLLSSVKGRGGGFYFEELDSVHSPTLYEVIKKTGDNQLFSRCGFGLANCDDKLPCPMHHEYLPLRDGFYKMVKTETIYSLAQKVMNRKAVLNRLVG
ncbi:hypothetical protein PbJCM13498_39310 [Prolixibacter bellariivorans]|uniref:Rrf2 family transcriptional regulator n=1 Tax=Prolixibacter bellariivorans TaxID=314319 RepID=A0A5M4B5E8_9BACT|nr:Rrf2 family transcriptional regulator [Prolixibacter bellariivorans]GET35068.1 hypothetical protein PbJCM13498_39310 [Prolixibacter bellariivorans]